MIRILRFLNMFRLEYITLYFVVRELLTLVLVPNPIFRKYPEAQQFPRPSIILDVAAEMRHQVALL